MSIKKNGVLRNTMITAIGIILIIFIWIIIKTSGNKNEVSGASNSERVSFLSSFGWETENTPCETKEITIPPEFGDTYEKYNEIQRLQGFDLRKYKGKTAKKYTYEILNYPSESETYRESVFANIIIYEGRIIGGDICCLELGGFMHGFSME